MGESQVIPTAGGGVSDYNSLTDIPTTITQEPTGFTSPEDVIVTGDSATRKVTLTGTVKAYYENVLSTTIVSGWVSDAHDSDTSKSYFLWYDGNTTTWNDLSALSGDFATNLLIAIAWYDGTQWVYQRECHGLMNWQAHKEAHNTIGTYRDSGGLLSGYTLDSVVDRQPTVSECVINDEDLPSTLTAISTASYTQFSLSSTDTINFNAGESDIIALSTNRPYYNEWDGSAYVQTLLDTNYHTSIWLVALPMGADANSQAVRFIWVQGQEQNRRINNEKSLKPNDVSLGTLPGLTPEMIFIGRVIVKYDGTDWIIKYVEQIDGTKYSQTTSPSITDFVDLGSDQSIDGIKTFTSSPIVPTPTTDYQVATKKFVDDVATQIPHTYTIQGEIKVPSGDTDFIPQFYVPVPSGKTVKVVKCIHKINSGTSVTAKLTKNGTDMTGFTSISVTTTKGTTSPTAVSIADTDAIALVVTAVSGTPKNMSFTIILEYS